MMTLNDSLRTDAGTYLWHDSRPMESMAATCNVGLYLFAGALTNHRSTGALAAAAVFAVAVTGSRKVLGSRLLARSLMLVGSALCTVLGMLMSRSVAGVYGTAILLALVYGRCSGLSPAASWLMQTWAFFLVVNSYFPTTPTSAVRNMLVILTGGSLQILLCSAVSVVKRQPTSQTPTFSRISVRCRQLLTRLRENLGGTLVTKAFTSQLLLTIPFATFLYRHWHIRSGFWLPMTVLMVLQPDPAIGASHALIRTAGTFMGALLLVTIVCVHPSPFSTTVYVLGTMVLALFGLLLQPVNYGAFNFFLCVFIVFLFHAGGFAQEEAAGTRVALTAGGAGLALLSDAVRFIVLRGRWSKTYGHA